MYLCTEAAITWRKSKPEEMLTELLKAEREKAIEKLTVLSGNMELFA